MTSESIPVTPEIESTRKAPSPKRWSGVLRCRWFSPKIVFWLIILALLGLGLGVRLVDVTDQPLDFHPTRQLRGAIIARGMYYQLLNNVDPVIRQRAITFWYSTGQYEPSILEALSARTYLLIGSEQLWVPRLYSVLFWLIGGIFLVALARRMLFSGCESQEDRGDVEQHSSMHGSISKRRQTLPGRAAICIALAYYLILPFAVQASRVIQPDPMMVMWIVITAYLLYRWSEQPVWIWALLAGLVGGMAILTKVVAGYLLAITAIVIVLYTLGIKRFWRNPQVWVMAILMNAPSLAYYVGREGRASDYFAAWTLSLSHLLIEPSFYVRWLNLVQDLMGLGALLLGLIGVLIARPRSRALLVGLWLGYFTYGLLSPYQMYTHSYYHIQLVPIVALSFASVAEVIYERLSQQSRLWQVLSAGILLVGLVFPSWISINNQTKDSYRKEPVYWQEIAAYLPTDGKIIALTQDYGYRLMYYGWRKVSLWPIRGEMTLAELRGISKDFPTFFTKRIEGKSYFVITAFGQYNDQPDLKTILTEQYPITAQGDGYLIFDLEHPK